MRNFLFFCLMFLPLITHSGKGDTVCLLSKSLELIYSSDLKASDLEASTGLTMEEKDEDYDPVLNISSPYLFYEAKPEEHHLYSEVFLKTPKQGGEGESIVQLFIRPEAGVDWDYALTFNSQAKGELSSDAGGRLTSIRYRINGKEIVFSKKRSSDAIYRVVIKG